MKLSKQSARGLRYSPMCGTVYDNGGFDYRLYPDSEDREVREASAACIGKGLPLDGHVDADGNITER